MTVLQWTEFCFLPFENAAYLQGIMSASLVGCKTISNVTHLERNPHFCFFIIRLLPARYKFWLLSDFLQFHLYM